MSVYQFKLPDIGEGIAEAEIVAWHVRVGERVEEDQQVADMMTDKATVEMESPVSGIVLELAGEVGDQVAIGSALMVVETDGEVAEEAPPSEEESSRRATSRSSRVGSRTTSNASSSGMTARESNERPSYIGQDHGNDGGIPQSSNSGNVQSSGSSQRTGSETNRDFQGRRNY